MRSTNWLAEVARRAPGPVPWAGMGLAALAVGLPLVVGIGAGYTVEGVLVAVGGLVGALADRGGPYPLRLRRIACVGAFGGATGVLVGTGIHGRGWLTVVALVAVAAVSALISSISATWSLTGLYLLVYAALAVGPLGALRPWWHTPLSLLAGVAWTLVLLVPGWLRHPRTPEQRRVAAVYRALAANLRALGGDGLPAARQEIAATLNAAYEDLRSQRAAASGRDRELGRLVTLLGQARLAAEAAAALAYAGARPRAEAAAQAEAIAAAVLDATNVSALAPPPGAAGAVLALHDALERAAHIVSDQSVPADVSNWPFDNGRQLAPPWLRDALTSTFAVRLMLCVGAAAVISEVLPLQRSYWVVLAVAVVMKPDFGSVFARALQYGAGTLLGAAVAALILAAGPPDAALLAPLLFFAALVPYGMSRNYGLFGLFFTPLVVMLLELLTHDGWHLAEARLIDILVGCAVVLCLGYAPWPSSWHNRLPCEIADALDDAATYLEQALADADAAAAAETHARARSRQAALAVEFQRSLTEPRKVRERVTAWWPALAALEQLLEAITATAVTGANEPIQAGQLAVRVRAMALTVRTGSPLPPNQEVQIPVPLELTSNAVRALEDAVADAATAQPHRNPDETPSRDERRELAA